MRKRTVRKVKLSYIASDDQVEGGRARELVQLIH